MKGIDQARLFREGVKNFFSKNKLFYVIEDADWVIKHDGKSITKHLNGLPSSTTTTPSGIRNAIVHYGSINTFFTRKGLNLPHRSNKIVVTWFHVTSKDEFIRLIPEAEKSVDLWHSSCEITREQLVGLGISREKIIIIPLGLNLRAFKHSNTIRKEEIRRSLGIPENKMVVGSFQKDGVGWGAGLEPKLIKGPDIFCAAVEGLAKRFEIFVLLTGPARGYVKRRLEGAGIPYIHRFVRKPDDLSFYYRALDLYIVASRIEGGPKALLEGMAAGVPIVTTKVGMAPEIVRDGFNGFIVDVEDANAIVEKSKILFNDKTTKDSLISNGKSTVEQYDWGIIAPKYHSLIYSRLCLGS
jgi:glycosyltransferase involved in cell wall biosynthesis